MRVFIALGLALSLGLGCASPDTSKEGEGGGGPPGSGGAGQGGPAPADAGTDTQPAAEAGTDSGPAECPLGTVEVDGECLEPCGNGGRPCTGTELCVLQRNDLSCRLKCGQSEVGCPIDEICYLDLSFEGVVGFCAPGRCPEGSIRGVKGWCVCETGDIPPPDLACRVELCGEGNPDGECDGDLFCLDGECK